MFTVEIGDAANKRVSKVSQHTSNINQHYASLYIAKKFFINRDENFFI